MKYFLFNLSFQDFLSKYIELTEEIAKTISTEDFDTAKDNICKFLEANISPNILIFNEILEVREDSFWDTLRNDKLEIFKNRKKQYLKQSKQLIDYFKMSDCLIDKSTELSFDNITEKTDFILKKLNIVFSSNYFYSIGLIFNINGIEYRDKENFEIGKDLKRRGYIILENEYGDSDFSKISVKGANYIERKFKSKTSRKNKKERTDIDKKLDIVLDKLTKLGYGQEIIFEEIEDLRILQTQLSKKSWTQLLKGKLIDLAIDEIISKETATDIFEFLTDTGLKLLK